MKKILTFLVMLFASVSILSAQTDYVPKFNYQAVVRDINNDLNLVVDQVCTVEVEIAENGTTVRKEVFSGENVKTNRNGMISLVIGEGTVDAEYKTPLDSINWSNASINSTFKVDGQTLSLVQTPVMAVPFALQAHSAPLEITTESICKYISTMSADNNKNDVDSILAAMAANADVWNYVKDTVKKYIKAHKSDVKDLALYFLGQITPADLEEANNAVSSEVKEKVNELLKQYAKSHKKEAFDVLAYYISTATVNDFDTIWKELRSSENFDTLFAMAQDSIIEYIKTHKDVVIQVAEAWLEMVTTEDVQHAKNYLQANNPPVYNYVLDKFHDYLFNYLTTKFYAVSDSCAVKAGNPRVDICDMVADVAWMQGLTCPQLSASVVANTTASKKFDLTITVTGITNQTQLQKISTVIFESNDDMGAGSWSEWAAGTVDGTWTRTSTYQASPNATGTLKVVVTYKENATTTSGCDSTVTSNIVEF